MDSWSKGKIRAKLFWIAVSFLLFLFYPLLPESTQKQLPRRYSGERMELQSKPIEKPIDDCDDDQGCEQTLRSMYATSTTKSRTKLNSTI